MKKVLILLSVIITIYSCAKKENSSKKPNKIDIKPMVSNTAQEKSDIKWFTNLEKAQLEAKKTGKTIFVHFTGSDWCKWCIRLNKEVYSKKEFSDYAKNNLVMVKFDYPRNTPQPIEVKEYNQDMLRKFGVQGFPTVFLLDFDLRIPKPTVYIISSFYFSCKKLS